jgi:hypothetical protein
MSDNIRIKTTPGGENKFLKVKINQKFDFIEILSLRISQNQAYKRFCSDYGVVVGRVIINNGVGVPNTKVSIFIPIDSNDALDPEIIGLYPFEIFTDKDSDGIPYNLLPKNSRGKGDCHTIIGTFPSKREIQDNAQLSDIYCKYYKYTTTTNDSGDFMIFGVPVGSHFLHVEADISDIGIFSQKPYELANDAGGSVNSQSPTKYKDRIQTSSLSQLKRFSPISVSVIPFWGDTEQCEVGISRIDVDLRVNITPSALFVGSIFSDSGKNSLGKFCIPREDMGNHAQLSTGSGSIEMIRKTRSGGTERFDVNGGQVIDDNGTWAYLIPMNLNYVVTSEEGDLIPSNDPTKGIPTTTNVRFRIGMNVNGSEGQSTTRAKYLVPNNPSGHTIDYNFDSSTTDVSFTELIWNEIYTVKNYIARTQISLINPEERNFLGIKDVDEGPFSPFPFNKLDIDVNPLFGLICLFLHIFVTILCAFNTSIIPLINTVIYLINIILMTICFAVATISIIVCGLDNMFDASARAECRCASCMNTDACDPTDESVDNCLKVCDDPILNYIPYITLECGANPSGMKYAPCGFEFGIDFGLAWEATNDAALSQGFHYPGDDDGHEVYHLDAGWIECNALGIAKALNVFKFDFYNDWVNGTLYSYLFSVKINGDKSKFCDTDCGGDVSDTNRCRNNYVYDTCTEAAPDSDHMNIIDSSGIGGATYNALYSNIYEGLIKRHNGEFYYVPKSDNTNKLYATDIVRLGSMVDCHWKGTPNMHKYFVETTYNMPPLIAESDDNGVVITGFDTNLNNDGTTLIGNIVCLPGLGGILTDNDNCVNIRRLSELGVGLDEDRQDIGGISVDNKIDNRDVEATYVRGMFAYLNGLILPSAAQGGAVFNEIKFDKTDNNFGYDDEVPYYDFRKLNLVNKIKEHDNSFYFYFGLINGNGAITKMNKNFFTECVPEDDSDFIVIGNVISGDDGTSNPPTTTPTGEIEINILNGVANYQIEWVGPTVSGVPYASFFASHQTDDQTLTDLYSGTYNVKVIDDLNRVAEGSFYVPGPDPVLCNVQGTNLSTNNGTDGKITVDIQNGIPPYSVELLIGGANVSTQTLSLSPSSTIFQSLGAGTYDVIVTDSATPQSICSRTVIITAPSILNVSVTGNSASCFGEDDGNAYVIVNGGVPPYVTTWVNSTGNSLPSGTTITNLSVDTYTATTTDSVGQIGGGSYPVTEPLDITFKSPIVYTNVSCKLVGDGQIKLENICSENDVEVTLKKGVSSTNIIYTSTISSGDNDTISSLDPGTYLITLTDVINGCSKTSSVIIDEPANLFSVNLTRSSIFFTTNSFGGWGAENNSNAANIYIYKWQYKLSSIGGVWTTVGQSYSPTNTYSSGGGTSIINLGFIGQMAQSQGVTAQVRCIVDAQNHTGSFCQQVTNVITV